MSEIVQSPAVINRGTDEQKAFHNPELVFGLVGPIGVDLNMVISFLEKSLFSVKYRASNIHLTDYMITPNIHKNIDNSSYYNKYVSLIEYANAFRREAQSDDAMAGIAIACIRAERERITGSPTEAALGTAYIVRQFKRAEEIDLMRKTYGRKFIQVSIFSSEYDRQEALYNKIKHFNNTPRTENECRSEAMSLIEKDYNQVDDRNGQRLSEVFHLGDVFVDGNDVIRCEKTIDKFTKALFGYNKSSPSRDEYGLYMATAAALRSADLSRQVGAAIFSKAGEIISLGCNEVPKAGGGTYWIDEEPAIFRDVEKGRDPNQEKRNIILYDFLDRLAKSHFLSERLLAKGNTQSQVDELLKTDVIKDAQVMDIIEFGRIIHAEMSAISDAARNGRSTRNAILFCTTFPCHMCAKHIVAAGIGRVVFLEPYPKSYSKELHGDSITFGTEQSGKVAFEPFIGISPRRYRDIFEKKKRKDDKGEAKIWYMGEPSPMIEDKGASYIQYEPGHAFKAIAIIRTSDPQSQEGAPEGSTSDERLS